MISRRTFLIGGIYSSVLFQHAKLSYAAGMKSSEKKIDLAFIVRKKDEQALRDFDKQVVFGKTKKYQSKNEDIPDPGFAPLVIMVGAVTIGYIAKVSFELWEEYKYSGLIIDLRQKPFELRESNALRRGHIIVINSDGKVTEFRPKNSSALEEILKKYADNL